MLSLLNPGIWNVLSAIRLRTNGINQNKRICKSENKMTVVEKPRQDSFLEKAEWDEFNRLLEKKEGTTYYDVLEMLLMALPGDIAEKVRFQKPNISGLAYLVYQNRLGNLKSRKE
jgi:hypothetical protein